LLAEALPAKSSEVVLLGEVRAAQRAELGFAVQGRVSAVLVDVGDIVSAGQILARLDAIPLQAQLASANAEVVRADIVLTELRQRRERMAPLAAGGVAVPAEWDALLAQLAAAEQQVKVSRGQRDAAVWNLEQMTLRAPFEAVVASRALEVGQAAGPGQPVLQLDGRGRQVVVPVPDHLAARVRGGQPVQLEFGDRSVEGRILQVGERAGPGGTVRVLTQAPAEARPGETLNVRFAAALPRAGSAPTTAVELPLRAVRPDGKPGSGSVLRYDPASGIVQARSVRLGPVLGERIVVLDGLALGDRVVAAGVSFLAPGSAVRPLDVQP
jgi:RND family efflux transporter MFP subunit